MEISKILKRLREQRDFKINKCAATVGVSPITYREWEYGRAISGEPYLKIAKLFDVSLSELFGCNESLLSKELYEIEQELNTALNQIKNIRSFL